MLGYRTLTLREGIGGILVAGYRHAWVCVWDGEEDTTRCWQLSPNGKPVQTTFRTFAYPIQRVIGPGKNWHGSRRNFYCFSTASAKPIVNAVWPIIEVRNWEG